MLSYALPQGLYCVTTGDIGGTGKESFVAERDFGYPIFLTLRGQRALVVGGGDVALRKARALAAAGASVRVVAPALAAAFRSDGRFDLAEETYRKRHLEGCLLAVAATDDEEVNARVAADAREAGALVNVVDRPALCDFIVPAQIERGLLRIAITTGGAAPALARRIRERLEKEFGPEYETYLAVMKEVREELKARNLSPQVRRRLFERLAEDDILAAAGEGADNVRIVIRAAILKTLEKGPA